MNQKGFSALVIVLIAFIVLVAIASLFYLKNSNQTNPTDQNSVSSPQPSSVSYPMEMRDVKLCDMNTDGSCDTKDMAIFEQSYGKARGDKGYNPSADVDADGKVTIVDEKILFGTNTIASPSAQQK